MLNESIGFAMDERPKIIVSSRLWEYSRLIRAEKI